MKTTWSWSLESEVNRIINTARSISNGFYHLHHYYPLPWEPKTNYLPQGAYLPTLSYSSYPDFWHRVLFYDNNKLSLPPQLTDLKQSLIHSLATLHLPTPNYCPLQAQWSKITPRFTHLVRSLAPYAPSIHSLTIHPTYFGTGGSFNLGSDIIVYLRLDQPVTTLAECILSALTYPYLTTTRHATWEESEFLVDYLLQETALSQLFPTPHVGTLAHLRHNISAKTIAASTHFLHQIGAPTNSAQTFSLKNGLPHFGSCPLTNLTSRESIIMTKFIEKSPSPVTIDELADLLFPNPNKFSLAALTKFIERLRAKLDDASISRHYLATASGVGYYLKN